MAQDDTQPPRGPSDAPDYSASQAPETRQEAEEQPPQPSDSRLKPGGARGAAVDPGMSSLDRDIPPHRGESPRQQDIGSTRNDDL